jgi:hypothetical protein
MSVDPSTTPTSKGMGAGPILGILLTVAITIILIVTFTLFILQRLRENRNQDAKQSDPESSLVAAPPYSSHRFGSSETVVEEKRAGDFGYGAGAKGLDEKRVMDRTLPALTRPSAAFQPSKYDTDFSAEKARRPAYLNAFVNASQADLQAMDPFADHTNTLRTKSSKDELRFSTAQTLRISSADTAVTSRSPSPYTYDGCHSEEQAPTYYSGSVADGDVDVPPMLPPLPIRTESSWNPFEHETYTTSSHY